MSTFPVQPAIPTLADVPANSAGAPPVSSSSATALAVHLRVGGSSTNAGPVARVSGGAPPAYNNARHLAHFGKHLSLEPGDQLNPILQVDASGIDVVAASPGMGVDALSARAEAHVASAHFLLTSNPSPPLAMLGILGLSFSASDIRSTATVSHVFGMDRSFVSGDASFGSLDIGGALIGRSIHFSGDAAANTVLFSSPTVTVTLDKQVVADLIPVGANHAAQPVSITTDAVDISLHNAMLFGKAVSGDMILGKASAGTPGLYPGSHNPVI